MTKRNSIVKITVEEKTLERLRPLGDPGESPESIINRIIDYIGFHLPEFKDSES